MGSLSLLGNEGLIGMDFSKRVEKEGKEG